MKNYYEILRVENIATADEIKASYRYLSKKFHPDMNSGDEKAAKYFREVNEAYECLKDTNKRKAYDAAYKMWRETGSRYSSEGNEHNETNYQDGQQNNNNSYERNRKEEIEKFEQLFKKIQKTYFIITSILSVIIAIGLYMEESQLFYVPFLVSIGLYFLLYLYFLPTILAHKKVHPYRIEIFYLNCFIWATLIAYVIPFFVVYVCLLIFSNNKVKGINTLLLAIIGLLFVGMGAKYERKK